MMMFHCSVVLLFGTEVTNGVVTNLGKMTLKYPCLLWYHKGLVSRTMCSSTNFRKSESRNKVTATFTWQGRHKLLFVYKVWNMLNNKNFFVSFLNMSYLFFQISSNHKKQVHCSNSVIKLCESFEQSNNKTTHRSIHKTDQQTCSLMADAVCWESMLVNTQTE